jgi:hypothetical protein
MLGMFFDQIQSCVEMVKKLGDNNVGDNFVVEMKALGDQKQKAEVEIETLKMDLQRLEQLGRHSRRAQDDLPLWLQGHHESPHG